uniref:Uncharacterized protein n=1 Tax=Leersia perrieri TaxID=77586 RepID=A0A0D9WWX6_9ORYZ
MARWDEILTLPVQNPPTPEFSAADIMWSMVEGWKDSMDRLALIPFSRVNDFVRGESNNKECPTRFHVEARRRRPPTMNCKPKVDGILESTFKDPQVNEPRESDLRKANIDNDMNLMMKTIMFSRKGSPEKHLMKKVARCKSHNLLKLKAVKQLIGRNLLIVRKILLTRNISH